MCSINSYRSYPMIYVPSSKRRILPKCLYPCRCTVRQISQSRETCPHNVSIANVSTQCRCHSTIRLHFLPLHDSMSHSVVPESWHSFVLMYRRRASVMLAAMCFLRLRVSYRQDHASANESLLLLLDAEVTLMPLRTRCTSVQIPNATRARTTNRTMIMMAMVSFFLTMIAVVDCF